jgi:hypothetical protein
MGIISGNKYQVLYITITIIMTVILEVIGAIFGIGIAGFCYSNRK